MCGTFRQTFVLLKPVVSSKHISFVYLCICGMGQWIMMGFIYQKISCYNLAVAIHFLHLAIFVKIYPFIGSIH